MKRVILLLTAIVVALGTWALWHGLKKPENPLQVPAFTLKDAQGREFSSKDAAGKPTLVHFWASWCPPCLEEFPDLLKRVRTPVPADLQFVLISHDSKWEDAQSLLPKEPLPASVHALLDSSTQVAERFGTFQIPETYLISADGRIVAKWVGPQKWSSDAMAAMILKALGK